MTAVARTISALLLLGATLVILLVRAPFVAAEAGLAADVADATLPGAAIAVGSRLFVGVGTAHVTGMQITSLCSTVVLAAPILLLGAALCAGLRRAHLRRIAIGTLVGLVIVIVANQVRYLLLGALALNFGREGFLIGHHWVGAIGVLLAFAAALFVTVRIAVSGTTRTTHLTAI